MCDFSLKALNSRPAKVGDKLITHNFGTGTSGFATVEDKDTAVCVLPGTEIAFDSEAATTEVFGMFMYKKYDKVAIFRQIDKDKATAHHDALEFPNGKIVLLTRLVEGQHATVLQLPAEPKNEQEAQEQTRLEIVA